MFNKIINHYRIISVFMYMLGKEWNNNNHLLCSFIQININDFLINYNDILWNESIFWATAIIRGRRTINRKKLGGWEGVEETIQIKNAYYGLGMGV